MALTHLENMNEQEVARYKIYMAIAGILPGCKSMEELANSLKQQDIETQFKYKGQTQEIQGVSFKTGEFCFKGSKVDRQFSFAGLQKAITLANTQSIGISKQEETTKQTQNINKEFRKILSGPRRTSEKPMPDTSGLDNAREIFKKMNEAMEELLKPEHTEDNLPYELTQKSYLRKKKKHRHRM